MSDDDKLEQEWIALGLLGGRFAEHAAGMLRRSSWGDAYFWCLVSAFNRHDREAAERFVRDWKNESFRRKKRANVSKWIPGSHYYALDQKFDTLAEAKEHLRDNGYEFGSLIETRVYGEE